MAANKEMEGQNLTQEIDELKAMMESMFGEMSEFRKFIIEAMNKAKGNYENNDPQYLQGFEPH